MQEGKKHKIENNNAAVTQRPAHFNLKLWMLGCASALLLSIPYIIPHVGVVALVAFLPLLAAEYIATENGKKNFWIIYYCTFLIWNIITTYWIYLATLPGAIAAAWQCICNFCKKHSVVLRLWSSWGIILDIACQCIVV